MAMTANAVRRWYLVHKWSSLVCTAFLLLLCLTGLPLIFHHEIDALSGQAPLASLPADAPPVPLDRLVDAARAQRPTDALQYLAWDADEPARVFVGMGATPTATEDTHVLSFDGRSGALLQAGKADEGFMHLMLALHVEMLAGLPGKLFLGVMGLLFAAAIVSGIAVYGPFMRKLDFRTVRLRHSRRLRWLDLHNLLGIVTVCWALVVGLTGVLNTWADLVLRYWQGDQLAAMVAPYKDRAPLPRERFGSLQAAADTATGAVPGKTLSFVAFPGTLFSSQHHYAVFMKGVTPLTQRLLTPVLVDAQDASLTDTRELPWYMTAILVSQPLHFGDYGGLPLKIIWALLDLATLAVLGSGLYLWLGRRKRPLQQRLDEVLAGGEPAAAAFSASPAKAKP